MTIRVLIADDQSMVRAGFRMLLAGEQDMEVVAEASNGLEAVAMAARFDPTVILMDIRMPELDGLQATRRVLATDNTARPPKPHRPRLSRIRTPGYRSSDRGGGGGISRERLTTCVPLEGLPFGFSRREFEEMSFSHWSTPLPARRRHLDPSPE